MNKRKPLYLILSLTILMLSCASVSALELDSKYQHVEIQTNLGNIIVQLDDEKAPETVANFMQYTKNKAYDGTIFHRVIKDFMIQGGGFTSDFSKTPTYASIPNEADNGLHNLRGTIAMARTREPHSATNQFFINTDNNAFLDHRSKSLSGWGYAVFGKVVAGMEVVDKINVIKTSRAGPFSSDVPVTTVIIFHVVPYTEKSAIADEQLPVE
jgi:cyclophilin family peptidyl-prolyl cis-trans isomerase